MTHGSDIPTVSETTSGQIYSLVWRNERRGHEYSAYSRVTINIRVGEGVNTRPAGGPLFAGFRHVPNVVNIGGFGRFANHGTAILGKQRRCLHVECCCSVTKILFINKKQIYLSRARFIFVRSRSPNTETRLS